MYLRVTHKKYCTLRFPELENKQYYRCIHGFSVKMHLNHAFNMNHVIQMTCVGSHGV